MHMGSKLASSVLAADLKRDVNLHETRAKFPLRSVNSHLTRRRTTWYAEQEIPFPNIVPVSTPNLPGPEYLLQSLNMLFGRPWLVSTAKHANLENIHHERKNTYGVSTKGTTKNSPTATVDSPIATLYNSGVLSLLRGTLGVKMDVDNHTIDDSLCRERWDPTKRRMHGQGPISVGLLVARARSKKLSDLGPAVPCVPTATIGHGDDIDLGPQSDP